MSCPCHSVYSQKEDRIKQCLFTAMEILTKGEVGTRNWGTGMIGLTIFLFGEMWIWGL